jgi:hypothetical protein
MSKCVRPLNLKTLALKVPPLLLNQSQRLFLKQNSNVSLGQQVRITKELVLGMRTYARLNSNSPNNPIEFLTLHIRYLQGNKL